MCGLVLPVTPSLVMGIAGKRHYCLNTFWTEGFPGGSASPGQANRTLPPSIVRRRGALLVMNLFRGLRGRARVIFWFPSSEWPSLDGLPFTSPSPPVLGDSITSSAENSLRAPGAVYLLPRLKERGVGPGSFTFRFSFYVDAVTECPVGSCPSKHPTVLFPLLPLLRFHSHLLFFLP